MNRLTTYLGESRALMAIAGPMMVAHLAQMGTGVVDTIMAGRYSAMDLAAIAIGYNIWLPIYLLFTGVMLGFQVWVVEHRLTSQSPGIVGHALDNEVVQPVTSPRVTASQGLENH